MTFQDMQENSEAEIRENGIAAHERALIKYIKAEVRKARTEAEDGESIQIPLEGMEDAEAIFGEGTYLGAHLRRNLRDELANIGCSEEDIEFDGDTIVIRL